MGLLEKASQHIQKEQEPVSTPNDEPIQKPSLLKKAEAFLEESPKQPEPVVEEEKPSLLKKAEKLLEEEKKFVTEELKLPEEEDVFQKWEEEAKQASLKAPIEPPPEKVPSTEEEYLFDDESDFSTTPIDFHLASKKKIENYLAAFEIAKELAASNDFSSFFNNIHYSITGQIGSETFALLSNNENNFSKLYLVEYQGFETDKDWEFGSDSILYSKLKDLNQVIYAGEILSLEPSSEETQFIELVKAEVLVPIRYGDEFYGILLVGKQLNGDEYTIDDLEFIKVVADISGAVFRRILEVQEKNQQLEELTRKVELQKLVLEFSRSVSEVRDIDGFYDLFISTLREKFAVTKFTFLIYDTKSEDEYRVFSSNQLSVESIESFRLDKKSDIVGIISNVSDFYEIENFRKNPELLSLLPNDELAVMDKFFIIPLINLNWLVGIFIIHAVEREWSNDEKFVILRLFEVAAPVLGNILILEDKKTIFSHPFSPLEKRLNSEIAKSTKLNTPFTVVIFKVQNTARMIQILGEYYFAVYCDRLRKTILNHLGENDHYVRVGRGKFACIYHGKDKEETEIIIRKIKAEFQPPQPERVNGFKPSYRILSLSYPKDTKEVSSFLEMAEEA